MRLVLAISPVVGTADGDGVPEPDESLLYGRLKNSELLRDLHKLLSHLPEPQRAEMIDLVGKYPSLFGDTPSCTDWVEHDIDDGDALQIKQRFYPMAPGKLK